MKAPEIQLTPNRPYLVRAIYEWLNDNALTPYIAVNALHKDTQVPQQFVQDGQIILNIAPHSVHQLEMTNEFISFSARFGGVSQHIYIPIAALLGIYARENGVGLFFDPNEYPSDDESDEPTETPPSKPKFKLVD